MKKTMVSLAAASLIVTSAMAADKGIDIVTTGQAVIYYETQASNATGDKDLFDETNSQANVGVQLNLDADLKNNFTFGSQLTYLGTAGLEKNVVGNTKQVSNTTNPNGSGLQATTTDQIMMTKIFVAKKIANSTVKIGRQELPKSLSPLAYTEGWNVFKNTFDAILAVNTDIPDTTLVGAYVSGGTGMDLSSTGNLVAKVDAGGTTAVTGTAYMLTVQNKSIPMTTLTATYYDLGKITSTLVAGQDIGMTAGWIDAKIAGKDLPMGLKIGLQAGKLMPDSFVGAELADTTALGAMVSLAPIDALTLSLAYTSVDGDDNKINVAVKNTGTGIKSPVFTQMIYNQDAISLDADTYMVKAAYNTGDYGTIIAQYAGTTAGNSNLMNATATSADRNDYGEFDLIYKVKAGGVQYFAAFINRATSKKNGLGGNADNDNKIRLWGRYNF
jgi:hypothetical protein